MDEFFGEDLKPQKRLKRELVHEGKIINFYCDTIELGNGKVVEYDYIGHNGAAAVLPVNYEGEILLVRQYRDAVDGFTFEIPAGGKNNTDEKAIDCAARELEEETGFYSNELVPLITINTTVAFCNEKIEIFFTKGLEASTQMLDEEECIEIFAFSLEEILDMIKDGEITDSKTVAAVLAYKEFFLDK